MRNSSRQEPNSTAYNLRRVANNLSAPYQGTGGKWYQSVPRRAKEVWLSHHSTLNELDYCHLGISFSVPACTTVILLEVSELRCILVV
jgi:hypothetical protein